MMDEEQYKATIVEKYREHFNHYYRLHQFVQAALQNNKWLTRNHHDAALLYIRPRAFKSFDSVRRLCEVASCEDAAVILRSLLNLMAVTRWISMEPFVRARKYLHWYWVQMHTDLQTLGDAIPSGYAPYIEERYRRVKKQFEYTDGKGKKKQAKKWHQPEARSEEH